MNEDRLQIVARVWSDIIGNNGWSKESASLRRAIRQLKHEEPTLKELHRLLSEIQSNQFLRKRMLQVFGKQQDQLKRIVGLMEKTLSRRKEAASAMRQFYLGKHQITYGENDTFDCEFGASTVKEIVEDAIDQYSYDEFGKTFDKTLVFPLVNEIEASLKSPAFTRDLLNTLVADFVAGVEDSSASEETLRPIMAELIGQLIECGHDRSDLASYSKSMIFQDGRSADERFKAIISDLSSKQHPFVILTCLEDLRFPGNENYKVGQVTLHGQQYDLSRRLDEIAPELKEIQAAYVAQLSNKVITEVSPVAFGREQAKEAGNQEIAKAIDILSLEDPQVLIREPSEEKYSRLIVLNDQMVPVDFTFANRVELYGKELDPTTRTNIDKILQVIGPILTKPPDQLTEFQRRILTGMHFYRRGNSAYDSRDKVVNYIVSLESMLIMTGEHPSSSLPKRVVDVMGIPEENRPKVRRRVEEAYPHRGEILHLGLADKNESERFSREMRYLDDRLLGIMLKYVDRPGCETLRQFIDLLEKETTAERNSILKTALLDINKQYVGSGILRHPDGTDIGDIEFTFSYKDDGRYVYMIGSVTSFKLTGSLTNELGHYIEGKMDGVAGTYRLELSIPFNPFDLMGLMSGQRDTVPFKVKALSKN